MKQTDFFKCLSDPTRLALLKIILVEKNICVCDLLELLDLSQPKISRHLALLRNHSILQGQRRGQWVYYQIHPSLPSWAYSILEIISKQNDEMINSSEMTKVANLES